MSLRFGRLCCRPIHFLHISVNILNLVHSTNEYCRESKTKTYSNTNGHAHGPHKTIHASGPRTILRLGDGLNTEIDTAQQHAATNSKHNKDSGPDGSLGVQI